MNGAANWRWCNVAALFDGWGHDPQLDRALADIVDTPTYRLAGAELRTGMRGVPIAVLRYVEAGPLRIVFKVVLGLDDNELAIVHVSRS